MARAIWTGSLSFGLVSIPVGLYAATEDKTVHFHQFQAGTNDRIRNKRVNERTGAEVDYDDIVKGYDVGDGEYVMIAPEELEAVEPGPSRTIEIVDFVDLESIDPIYYKTSYYLAPQGRDAQRAYELLRQAMAATKKVGIATFILRSKQHLVAVRPEHGVLGLETMFFSDEIRDPAQELDTLASDVSFTEREMATATLLIDSMSAPWDPDNYVDAYRRRVGELIERKRQGEAVSVERPVPQEAPVVDLVGALEASVEAARHHRPGNAQTVSLTEMPMPRRSSPRSGAAVHPTSSENSAALTKAELYQRATALGIPGRSKMSRQDLEAAVTAAAPVTAPVPRRRRAS